jgi:hypothetical protein
MLLKIVDLRCESKNYVQSRKKGLMYFACISCQKSILGESDQWLETRKKPMTPAVQPGLVFLAFCDIL